MPNLKPTAGAEEFVKWLTESMLKVVIATSAKEEEVKGLLKVCGGEALAPHPVVAEPRP